jgi:hypothetical protein
MAVVAVLAAGCSSSASTAGGPSGGTTASGVTVKQAAAATAITRQYTVSPGQFPVSAPLPRPLAKGTEFGWLQCGAGVAYGVPVARTTGTPYTFGLDRLRVRAGRG